MDLTKQERLIIANQFRILEKLYPEEADYYSQHRKAVEEGYKLHYNWIMESLHDEMPEADCQEVLDVLDMYRALTFSCQKLKKEDAIEADEIRFPGFDGNSETRQFSYVNYFILDLGRYNELRYGAEYPDFNSHSPQLDKYRRMLSIWETHKEKRELNAKEIKAILEA